MLQKLQSIECKALKLALGLPVHASSIHTYYEAQMLPLDDYRKLSCSKFVIKNNINNTNIKSEVKMKSHVDFPKWAKSIASQVTLATYTLKTIKILKF